MKNERSKGLTALCVLSGLWIAVGLFTTLNSLMAGPMTDAQLRQEKLEMLEGQTEESLKMIGGLLDEMVQILEITRDNLYFITGINLLGLIIGGIGVYFMFQLKKKGFHFYIVYSLLAIVPSVFLFSSFSIGIAGIIFTTIISILFILLYNRQVKKMA